MMEIHSRFSEYESSLLDDSHRYRRLMGKYINLKITCKNWEGALRVLSYVKHALEKW